MALEDKEVYVKGVIDAQKILDSFVFLQPSRELSLAKTKLEEAMMWIERDIDIKFNKTKAVRLLLVDD